MPDYNGTEDADTIVATTRSNNYIMGNGGNDTITGGNQFDYIDPGTGADVVNGGSGVDTVVLIRDGAVDDITLGTGADKLVFQTFYTEGDGLAGIDRIRDFSVSQGDRIDLNSAYGRLVGTNSYLRWEGQVTTAGFSLSAGQRLGNSEAGFIDVRTWTNAGKTYLIMDVNGDGLLGQSDFIVQFDGAPGLARSTFVDDTFGPDTGSDGADTWIGTSGFDRYFGLGGNDIVSGGGGDDELQGGTGEDRLNGDGGDDLLVGGAGSDILRGGEGADKLYASSNKSGEGEDAAAVEELFGDAGDDSLYGGAGRDILDGGDGDDHLSGGVFDTLLGGAGDDVIAIAGGIADGGAGSDLMYFAGGGSIVTGGAGADEFQVRAGSHEGNFSFARNRIADFSAAEGDYIHLNASFSFAPLVFRGGLDNPGFSLTLGVAYSISDFGPDVTQLWTWKKSGVTYVMIDLDRDGLVSTADFVLELTGDIPLTAGDFRSTDPGPLFLDLEGATNGVDVYSGTADADTFRALGGDDRINGGSGDDTLYGGAGNDIIDGGLDADRMSGWRGNDTYYIDNPLDYVVEDEDGGLDIVFASVTHALDENVENLTLTGSADIHGTGNERDNVIRGNVGNNVLRGGSGGSDSFYGGKGADTYYVNSSDDQVFELKGQGEDLIYSSASYTLAAGSYVETLVLTGTGNLNGTGNGAGNTLRGNIGNNVLNGGAAADTLIGGLGDDIYHVDNTGDVIVEVKSEGADTVFSSVNFVLQAGVYVENLTLTGSANLNATGNGIANVLNGNGGKNVLNGGAGADRMVGGLGNDTYYVDNASDVVIESKGQGTDWVYTSVSYSIEGQYVEYLTLTGTGNINATGNGIDNRLVGNSGDNRINGLAGQDRLTGGAGADTFIWDATSHSKVSNSDRITDLTNADFIDLSRIDANTTVGGTQHFVLVDAFTNTAGQVVLKYDGTYTNLTADTNGDGKADMLIRIDGNHEAFDNFIFGGG